MPAENFEIPKPHIVRDDASRLSTDAWVTSDKHQQRPIQSTNDLIEFGKGLIVGSINTTEAFIEFLATPDSVNHTLIGIGPMLDTSVNYYADKLFHGKLNDIGKDLGDCTQMAGKWLAEYGTKSPVERGKICGEIATQVLSAEVAALGASKLVTASEGYITRSTALEVDKLKTLRIKQIAGAGGDWPVINERISADVVKQSEPMSCVAACGEMLSEGKVSQTQLIEAFKGSPRVDGSFLPKQLGEGWRFGTIAEEDFQVLLRKNKTFSAELRDKKYHGTTEGPNHQIIVDGTDEFGNIKIRDPQDGTRYEMTWGDFNFVWTGRVVFYNK